MTSEREAVAETVERLIDEVNEWPHVAVGEHRFGGTEFRVGPREIGHVHAWGMLDIAYLRKLRDVLVDDGETGPHHLLSESGWTTEYVESPDDFEHARWLLRLSYLYHVNVLQRTPAGAEEFEDLDVAAELEALDVSERIRDAFERRDASRHR
ncbi:luciferase family protein [Halosimplex sp. TS25]|uniref:luciferase domain-containing protein n=1 Tax=Halosimplex rarum TaxID=3396619 RepID=UPI0039EBA859